MTALYEKRGRRYVPVQDVLCDTRDYMQVGTFRLTYAYEAGGRRYEYKVTPATASWAAAAMIARDVMVAAMQEAAIATPAWPVKYTQKQLDIIERYRKEMADAGGNLPGWWNVAHPWSIADAAIEALEEWKP